MGTIAELHLNDGWVIFWSCVALCVGWWANNGLRSLWYGALGVADEAAQWGIALCAAAGFIGAIVVGIALANGWRP